jgi:hypothetical protein
MIRLCPICDEPFKDGDKVVASMLSRYKALESSVHYAIEQPTLCIEIVHSSCFDWDEHDEFEGGAIE